MDTIAEGNNQVPDQSNFVLLNKDKKRGSGGLAPIFMSARPKDLHESMNSNYFNAFDLHQKTESNSLFFVMQYMYKKF